MLSRLARKLFGDRIWLLTLGALILGTIAGDRIGRIELDEGWTILGHAWKADTDQARAALATAFSIQVTVLTIAYSLNTAAMQSAANQYSPRLVPFYLKNAPLRRSVPIFVLSGAYLVSAMRTLGILADETVRPRPVVTGALVLLVLGLSVATLAMVKTYRYLRVERVLGLVREATFETIERVSARRARFHRDRAVTLELPLEAEPLYAQRSGYLAEVDLGALARRARRAGARVRICRALGDYVDEGEVIAWAAIESGGALGERRARRLARALIIAPYRRLDFDPLYGIRVLADVAIRAVSSSTNDPYTARQALQQLRTVLRYLARLPLGDWSVLDRDGKVRVSVMAAEFREFVSVAVESPLRWGAGDPEVLDGVLEIALEVGLVARDVEGRAVAEALVTRVLDDAAAYGKLGSGRLARLQAEADLVRSALERDVPRAERHVRSIWALPREGDDRSSPATMTAYPQPG